MEKMQILFPESLLSRLRRLAEHEDRAVSDLVRRAVEQYVEQRPYAKKSGEVKKFPTRDCGKILVSADKMKEVIYDEDF